ncbi:hypothetical protein ACLOJK_010863 [Asimina triloba]
MMVWISHFHIRLQQIWRPASKINPKWSTWQALCEPLSLRGSAAGLIFSILTHQTSTTQFVFYLPRVYILFTTNSANGAPTTISTAIHTRTLPKCIPLYHMAAFLFFLCSVALRETRLLLLLFFSPLIVKLTLMKVMGIPSWGLLINQYSSATNTSQTGRLLFQASGDIRMSFSCMKHFMQRFCHDELGMRDGSYCFSNDLLPPLGCQTTQSAKLRKHIISPMSGGYRCFADSRSSV